MKPLADYSLYLVTDRRLMTSPTIAECVAQAIRGGCTLVQLREKEVSSREFYETALAVKEITRRYGVPLIINDRVDIALVIDAEGVHVGQRDLPAAETRRIIGPDKILGVSASNVAEALTAVADGADYLGVGAMNTTSTKTDARSTTMEELAAIRRAVAVPIVAIGGINQNNAPLFASLGVDGLAVVSAIVAQPDVAQAARKLKEAFKQGGGRQ